MKFNPGKCHLLLSTKSPEIVSIDGIQITSKYDKVALQLYWNHTSACVFSCKFAAYFQKTFY